ncbi:DUF6789 family protein [Arthrobacter sp. B3I4]|uniref:DUF6789 family protein n=1 Tax=Arthrobacter sp. B3I4 TaxID=3042267 RepID=UPI00278AB911|nr:DUF6789 family protein [Arthrobacter sp. B3I4]MDQ0756404.1 hypothetical protein [Arthrobacter sp. B3I4]
MDIDRRDSPLPTLARGGLAGLAATAAMSTLLLTADASGVMNNEPPKRIIDAFFPRLPLPLTKSAAVGAHLGYGMAAGALYAMLGKKKSTPATGLAYGAVLWAAGYEGWLPALGVLPPAHRDKPGRAWTMLAAHLLYGATLGKTFESLTTSTADAGPAGRAAKDASRSEPRRGPLSRLPGSYTRYLADKDQAFTRAVLPVLEQSAAQQEHGVHVRYVPGGVQALEDETAPYPGITEGVD